MSNVKYGVKKSSLSDIRSILEFARIGQIPNFIGRALGFGTIRHDEFLPFVEPAERARLRSIADSVRGPGCRPAVFVHGVLPRSGTNFVADALALHPDLHQNPGRLWEFPLLYVAGGARALQREFLFMFKDNAEVLGRYDMLAHLASGWMRALQEQTGERRMLFKVPHMQNVGLFPDIFPRDVLVLVLRDGRDVIHSSEGTFRDRGLVRKGFRALADEWREACDAVMTFAPGGENAYPGAKVLWYEDLVRDPEGTMRDLLAHARLDPGRYDFDALKRLPVRGSSTSAAASGWKPQEKSADFNPLGRWREWPAAKKARFKSLAGDALKRAGYERDDAW